MSQILLIALRNIFAYTRRSLILGIALAFVSFLLVGSFAASSALQEAMVSSATSLASGHVNVGGFYKSSAGVAQPQILDHAKIEGLIADISPHITKIQPRVRGKFDRITSHAGSLMNSVAGLDFSSDLTLKEKLTILDGDLNDLNAPYQALLFKRQADKLEVGVGDPITLSGLTARGVQNRIDATVAVIAKDMGGLSQVLTFLSSETINELYEYQSQNTGALMVYLDDKDLAEPVAQRIRERLDAAGYTLMAPEAKPYFHKYQTVEREDWTGQRLDISTWRDEMGDLAKTVDVLDGASVLLASVLLIIIAIGLWNTMLMAVRERTPEIGALRAIGMSRGRVRLMIVAEATFLALMASSIGALFAVLAVFILNTSQVEIHEPVLQFILMSDRLTFSLSPGRIFGAIAYISTFAAIAALWPASRAAKIEPGVAMSHAG